MSTEKKGYDFETAVNNDESTKVQAAAVTRAKQKMEEEQLERDARQVQNRLEQAERDTKDAERAGRYASKKKNILKTYSEGLQTAKEKFESDGDWKAYDDAVEKLKNEKNESIQKAKEAVYGRDAWAIRD
jgi:hypothetical protein